MHEPLPLRRRALMRLLAGATVAATTAATATGARSQAAASAPAQDVPESLTLGAVTLRFASVPAGRAVLTADDDYMRAASSFQRRAVTGRATPVSVDEFKRWTSEAVRPWPAEARQRWLKAAATVLPAFAALRVPLPAEVMLIATNGQESANAPHTRANAVVLPGQAHQPGYNDAMLLAHELWHVASRHAPALATRLYAELGFEAMPELAFPAAWADIRIANPDAPDNRHAMALAIDGRNVRVTPVLVAKRTDLAAGETFFDVLDVRLLEVEPAASGSATSRAATAPDGGPRWHPIQPGYVQRLGGNTGYIIHVEEAMADNVALLALREAGAGTPPVRNGELLDRLKAVLARG